MAPRPSTAEEAAAATKDGRADDQDDAAPAESRREGQCGSGDTTNRGEAAAPAQAKATTGIVIAVEKW